MSKYFLFLVALAVAGTAQAKSEASIEIINVRGGSVKVAFRGDIVTQFKKYVDDNKVDILQYERGGIQFKAEPNGTLFLEVEKHARDGVVHKLDSTLAEVFAQPKLAQDYRFGYVFVTKDQRVFTVGPTFVINFEHPFEEILWDGIRAGVITDATCTIIPSLASSPSHGGVYPGGGRPFLCAVKN